MELQTAVILLPSETLERIMEANFEKSQDNLKSGFTNLSNSRDVHIDPYGHKINARGGDDNITTGDGRDTIFTGSGNDTVFAGGGDDTVTAGSGDDTVVGEEGNDTVFGGSGIDTLEGGIGNDTLNGGTGIDTLIGGSDHDLLNGGADNDFLFGDLDGEVIGGNDKLDGGFGDDTLEGGAGADILTGGDDADLFVFRVGRGPSNDSPLSGRDSITDFSRAQGDRIDLSALDALLNQSGDQRFTFLGTLSSASSQAGSVSVVGTGADVTVFVNIDGGSADMAINVHLTNPSIPLSAVDFIL
jgi:Ca2+-binding RTX toxin-like protein